LSCHRPHSGLARGGITMFVTPLYAGILTLWFVVLSVRVMNLRRDVPFGDNHDIAITRVIRAQANFAEYVPLALLLISFLEHSRHLTIAIDRSPVLSKIPNEVLMLP